MACQIETFASIEKPVPKETYKCPAGGEMISIVFRDFDAGTITEEIRLRDCLQDPKTCPDRRANLCRAALSRDPLLVESQGEYYPGVICEKRLSSPRFPLPLQPHLSLPPAPQKS